MFRIIRDSPHGRIRTFDFQTVLFTAVALIAGVLGALFILEQDSSSVDLSVAVSKR